MNFSDALELLRLGKKLAREDWNRNMFIFLVPGSTFEVNRKPLLGIYPEGTTINYCAHIDAQIDIKTGGRLISTWTFSQVDILAYDWMIIE